MAKGQLRISPFPFPTRRKTAKFTRRLWFKRFQSVVATRLTDGVINPAFLQFRNQDDAGDERAFCRHTSLWRMGG
jgi:hypothetical protein